MQSIQQNVKTMASSPYPRQTATTLFIQKQELKITADKL
jgi:hypothetical protein